MLLFAFFALFHLSPDALRAGRWGIALLMAGIVWGLAKLAGRYLEDQRWQRGVLASWRAKLAAKPLAGMRLPARQWPGTAEDPA